MLIFGLHSTSDNQPGCSMDSNPIHHPSPAQKMKCSFLDYVQLLIIGTAGWWTRTPSASPLSQPKKWNATFWIMFNFWWSAWLVDGLEPHLPALSSQKNEIAHFWIMFNFWWLAELLDWLEPHPPPLLHPKTWNACLCITFNIWCWPDWSMDSNPICHPL